MASRNEHMPFDHNDTAQMALDSVTAIHERVAERAASPQWYHPAMGLSIAVAIGTGSFSWDLIPYGVVLGLLLVPFVLSTIVDRRSGISINRYGSTPNARRAAGGFGLALGLLALTGIVLQWVVGLSWAMAACGAVAMVLTVLCGRHIERTMLSDLRA